MVKTALALRQDFVNCSHVIIADRDYSEVTRSYLLGAYYSWFKTFLFGGSNDVPITWHISFDCDDFARLFCALLQLAHYKNAGSNTEGVAVGEVHYIRESGSGHAIVCAYTDVGRIFIEPQTGQQIYLSNEEVASIFFVRF